MSNENSIVRDTKGRWIKGVSGNPNGRPPVKDSLATVLREVIDTIPNAEKRAADLEDRPPRTFAELVVERLLAEALKGNIRAIALVLDRMDGKARSNVQVDVDVGGEVKHKHAQKSGDMMRRIKQLKENLEANAKVLDLPEGSVRVLSE